MWRSTSSRLYLRLGAALVVLAGLAGGTYPLVRRLVHTSQWIGHTHEVRQRTQAVLTLLQRAEVEHRAYLLTGKASFRAAYEEAAHAVSPALTRLSAVTTGPSRQRGYQLLAPLVRRRLAQLQTGLDVYDRQGPIMARHRMAVGSGDHVLHRIRHVAGMLTLREDALLRTRSRALDVAAHTATGLLISGSALALLLIVSAARLMRRDLAERRAAEEDRGYLAAIVQGSDDAIIGKTLDGTIVSWNAAAERMYGYSAAEVRGRPIALLFPPDSAEDLTALMQTIASGRSIEQHETVRLTQTGKRLDVSLSISPIYGRDGTIIGASSIARDISDRKRTDEALRLHADELARSNAALERFIQIASHDLQEPVRQVGTFAQLLARRYRDRLDGDGAEFIAYIVDGAQRLHQLIGDLLAYSRVRSRRDGLAPVDLADAWHAACDQLATAIRRTGAVVTADALPRVRADQTQLTELFAQLISNALKFYVDAPPRVHLSSRRNADEWLFCVRDHGIGIEAQYIDRIFELFRRLHRPAEYPGTGVGLAICAQIIQRHGGRIWVESQPGQGCSFFFTLPAAGGDIAKDGGRDFRKSDAPDRDPHGRRQPGRHSPVS